MCGEHREDMANVVWRTVSKEERVRRFLTERFVIDSHNQPLPCGRRPDFIISYPTYKIIVEVDEKQHYSYRPIDEMNRMKQIYRDLQIPLLFIRYNPSFSHRGHSGRVKSRLEELASVLRFYQTVPSLPHSLSYIKMFYDKSTLTPIVLDPYSDYLPSYNP